MALDRTMNQQLTDDMIGFGIAIIKDLKTGSIKTLVDTGNLKDSQIVVGQRPTKDRVGVIMSEASYAPYVGSKNQRPNSFMKQHLNSKVPELTKIIKETVSKSITFEISNSLKSIK
jgi:hypothetical protein